MQNGLTPVLLPIGQNVTMVVSESGLGSSMRDTMAAPTLLPVSSGSPNSVAVRMTMAAGAVYPSHVALSGKPCSLRLNMFEQPVKLVLPVCNEKPSPRVHAEEMRTRRVIGDTNFVLSVAEEVEELDPPCLVVAEPAHAAEGDEKPW